MTSEDRRVRRTQRAIFDAFRTLVMERPYDEIRVGDIIAAAGIGRSTFYEHYRNKDEVLTDTITWLFEALADAAAGHTDEGRLLWVLDHFYEQRHFGRMMLSGEPLQLLIDRLASLIEERGAASLHARAIAAAQLEIIGCWLAGRVASTREEVFAALCAYVAPTLRPGR
ncbi:MAG: TetR/AcrR family transcriptional regulator [Myxococcota bacterium]